jgi:peroxiredoxin
MCGRKYMGTERTALIITADGRIRKIFANVLAAL